MLKPKKEENAQTLEEKLPLVLEIIPGQAREGLIDIYDAGTYEGKTAQDLVYDSLRKDEWSIEEKDIINDIRGQLEGGKLLYNGGELEKDLVAMTKIETTEAGEKYRYAQFKAIKPQEGGYR